MCIRDRYSAIADAWKAQMKAECEFEVELGWRRQYCGIKSLVYQGVTDRKSVV